MPWTLCIGSMFREQVIASSSQLWTNSPETSQNFLVMRMLRVSFLWHKKRFSAVWTHLCTTPGSLQSMTLNTGMCNREYIVKLWWRRVLNYSIDLCYLQSCPHSLISRCGHINYWACENKVCIRWYFRRYICEKLHTQLTPPYTSCVATCRVIVAKRDMMGILRHIFSSLNTSCLLYHTGVVLARYSQELFCKARFIKTLGFLTTVASP